MLKFNKTRGYGFTLIELLAVIVILAIIALIATPIVLNIIEDSKKSAFVQTGNGIVDAAEYYYMNEMSDGTKPTENKVFTFNGSTSGLEGLEFDGEIPKSGTLTVDVNGKVELVAHNNQYCITKGYEENEITIKDYDDNCKISKPICTLISDADNSGTVTAGDKYQCKVKDDMEEGFENGYYFYVLSHNYDENDNTKIISTNLIMDRNIYYDSETDTSSVADSTNTGTVAWVSDSTYGCDEKNCVKNDKGPITAMNYLYNATKDWTNIPDIIMNYTDEGNTGDYGYGTIITMDGVTKITKKDETAVPVLTDKEGYTNLKARMPYKSEVADLNGSNGYLYDYLNSYNSIQINPITGIYGYWTLSSYAGTSDLVWCVGFNGDAGPNDVDYGGGYGVRPVINLKI